MNPKHIEMAKPLVAAGIFSRVELEGGYLVINGSHSVVEDVVDRTQASIKGTTTIQVPGFAVDAFNGDDVVDLGTAEQFFDALKIVARSIVEDRIDQVAETAGIAEMIEEDKKIKAALAQDPGLLTRQ
jgi:hypothetical protein